MFRIGAEAPGQCQPEPMRLREAVAMILFFQRQILGLTPNRDPIGPPEAAERPSWQRFAGIPLPLTALQGRSRGESARQAPEESCGQEPFRRTERSVIPFRCIPILEGVEGRFSSHGEADV